MNTMPPDAPEHQEPRINFLRPRSEYMRREVLLISVMLLLWALLTFGFQFLLMATQRTAAGEGPLTEAVLFGFPLHYWVTGQFLIFCFIALCFAFNAVIDRLTRRFRKPAARRS